MDAIRLQLDQLSLAELRDISEYIHEQIDIKKDERNKECHRIIDVGREGLATLLLSHLKSNRKISMTIDDIRKFSDDKDIDIDYYGKQYRISMDRLNDHEDKYYVDLFIEETMLKLHYAGLVTGGDSIKLLSFVRDDEDIDPKLRNVILMLVYCNGKYSHKDEISLAEWAIDDEFQGSEEWNCDDALKEVKNLIETGLLIKTADGIALRD